LFRSMLSSDLPDFALVSGTEMSLEVNCSIDPCCGFTGLSVGNLSGRDMMQTRDILGIHDIDETLILIRADCAI
jgi:hypothetical protein